MTEMRSKRYLDVENSTSKHPPSSASFRVNTQSALPAGQASIDAYNESLEELVKKVKQKAKDSRANQSSGKEAGQPALSNIFNKGLQW
jgi:ribosome-associated translation inhibitor RaiA